MKEQSGYKLELPCSCGIRYNLLRMNYSIFAYAPLRDKRGRDTLGGRNQHIHTAIYKIDSYKNLLYRTRNSTQGSVMAYMGKESLEKVLICIHICTPETNTAL